MKNKDTKKKVKRKLKKKVVNKNKVDFKWIIIITVLAFLISFGFSALAEVIISNVSVVISIIIVLLVIMLGVLFDIIGVAITVADSKVFHSMAAKKVKRARLALRLIKSKDKVSSFCNDVVGDICGIISGSCGAVISAILVVKLGVNGLVPSLIITSLIAALTIGGKAIGKGIAVNNANSIIDNFSRVLHIFVK